MMSGPGSMGSTHGVFMQSHPCCPLPAAGWNCFCILLALLVKFSDVSMAGFSHNDLTADIGEGSKGIGGG